MPYRSVFEIFRVTRLRRRNNDETKTTYEKYVFDICVNIKLKYQYLTNRDGVSNAVYECS